MRGVGAAMLAAAAFLVPALQAAAAPGPAVEVLYEYSQPASWKGEFLGRCHAGGIEFPSNRAWSVPVAAEGAQLVLRRTRVNVTTLTLDGEPWESSNPVAFWQEVRSVPAGAIQVSWTTNGLGAAFERNLSQPEFPDKRELNVLWRANEVNAGRMGAGAIIGDAWKPSNGKIFPWEIVGGAGARAVHFVGHAQAEGSLTFYLREATIQAGPDRVDLPPFRTEEANLSTPAGSRKTILYTDAFLHLTEARFRLDEANVPLCVSIHGRHKGSFVAATATGNATAGAERIQFSERALNLEGEYDVSEASQWDEAGRGRIQARSAGAIAVVGTDFEVRLTNAYPPGLPEAGLVALVIAAVAAVLYKCYAPAVAFFYSRLSRDKVLDQSNRDLLFQLIKQAPGIRVKQLREATGWNWNNVTYHLEVLQRVGLVGTKRVGAGRVAFATGTVSERAAMIASDRRLGLVWNCVKDGPAPLRDAVAVLQRELGLSLPRAYDAVDRAVKLGIVAKTGRSGEVFMLHAK